MSSDPTFGDVFLALIDGTNPGTPPVTSPRTFYLWFDSADGFLKIIDDGGHILTVGCTMPSQYFAAPMIPFAKMDQMLQDSGLAYDYVGDRIYMKNSSVERQIPTLLAEGVSVDVHDASTDLYTVPTGYSAIVTAIYAYGSTSAPSVTADVGWNGGADVLVIDLTTLASADDVAIGAPVASMRSGVAGDVLTIVPNVPDSTSHIVLVDIVGYLRPA